MTELPPHDWHAPLIGALVDAYARFRPVTYIEIGVDRGHTFHTVAPRSHKAYAVDVTFEHYQTGKAAHDTTYYEGTSDGFFATYTGPTPDVIFIDGDHTAEQVRKDVFSAGDIIAMDGTIVVHDTLPLEQRYADSHCGDGHKIITELDAAGFHIWTVPLFPGLSFLSTTYEPLLP